MARGRLLFVCAILSVGVLLGAGCEDGGGDDETQQASPPLPSPPEPACQEQDPSKYGFEAVDTAWMPQTSDVGSRAVTEAERSEEGMARLGCYSLKLTVDLVGGDPNRSKGEAFVDMLLSGAAPEGVTAPTNLDGKTVTIWVRLPAAARGENDRPNGLQVFAKDSAWRSEYGAWRNIESRDRDTWFPVTLTVSRSQPGGGYMDDGFDPTNIRSIGIKIGAGGGSTATFQGAVYIDAIEW